MAVLGQKVRRMDSPYGCLVIDALENTPDASRRE
jgi:hypothetical protein